jgi:hypothetical protein
MRNGSQHSTVRGRSGRNEQDWWVRRLHRGCASIASVIVNGSMLRLGNALACAKGSTTPSKSVRGTSPQQRFGAESWFNSRVRFAAKNQPKRTTMTTPSHSTFAGSVVITMRNFTIRLKGGHGEACAR